MNASALYCNNLIIIPLSTFVILLLFTFPLLTSAATVANSSLSVTQSNSNIMKMQISVNSTTKINQKKSINKLNSTKVQQTTNLVKTKTSTKPKSKKSNLLNPNGTSKDDAYRCPGPEKAEFQLFPVLCSRHGDCMRISSDFRCCKQFGSKRCIKAVAKPVPEQKHQPLLGVIPRICPKEPLGEFFWQVQTCESDQDCWPRVCCPDGIKKYCRTSKPEFDQIPYPAARQLSYPLESISSYVQCTPPPPPIYDKFPKVCNTTLDCFPNVCCQEAGKKHCRPPRRSLLALVAGIAQRFNTGIFSQWTNNLIIK